MPLYFLRHGESEANEQNLFAGRLDSPLTRLGLQQAEAAHKQIAKAGIVFDEIHTSPLTRARETGAVLASGSTGPKPREIVSDDLLERDFGILSENNKTLIKKHFGYTEYDTMFHSAHGSPPGGESFHRLYDRIATYYRDILLPLSAAGKTVLVVAHKYPIEMFALVAADLSPDDYQDFKIPNSKPSSLEDLGRHARGVPASVNWLGEMIEIHLPTWLGLALGAGILLKAMLLTALPASAPVGAIGTDVFFGVLLVFTAINSFFVFLRAQPETLRGTGAALRRFWLGTALRVALALGLIFGLREPVAEAAGLFLLVPPTMAVPTLSLMWGGDYVLSLQYTLGLSLGAPLILLAVHEIAQWSQLPMAMDLRPFMLLFGFGVIVPGALAQGFRRLKAIRAGAISTNWAWLGGAALIPLALAAGFSFVSPNVLGQISTQAGAVALEGDAAIAIALLVVVRLCGVLANLCARTTGPQAVDGYLCSIAPNIFFWCSLTSGRSSMFALTLLVLYFASLWLEDRRFVRLYAQGIAAQLRGGDTLVRAERA